MCITLIDFFIQLYYPNTIVLWLCICVWQNDIEYDMMSMTQWHDKMSIYINEWYDTMTWQDDIYIQKRVNYNEKARNVGGAGQKNRVLI